MESSSSFVHKNEFLDVLLQPFQHFSDLIGKQSAMSKRGQEATSGEGSPMAKPRPMIPTKAKPANLALRSPWSTRENPQQNLGHSVDPVNVMMSSALASVEHVHQDLELKRLRSC